MSEFNETLQQPGPREVLSRFLENEPVGSPKWLYLADRNALLAVETELIILQRDYPNDYLNSLPGLQAIAEQAQIKETMRNRSVGPDAMAYNTVDGLQEVYDAYYFANRYIDPQSQRVLNQETNQRLAAAINADMHSIIADRAEDVC